MHMRRLGIALLVIIFLVLSAPAALALPVANFTNATPTQGFAPLRVNFTNLSTANITQWNWSFGDGTWFNNTNNLTPNASHLYTSSGQFTVNLTVRNVTGVSTLSKPNFVNVTPRSAFATYDNTGVAPQFVAFVDQSTGTPAVWNWSFGDGQFFNTTNATLKNATHTFVNPGTYIVNLTVRNGPLNNTSSQTVTALQPGSAGFVTVNYTDPLSIHGATVKVLVYTDQDNNNIGSFAIPINNTTILMALRNLHYNYTATNNPVVFTTQMTTGGPWAFVVWNEELYDPPGGTYDKIQTYINGGGKALVTAGTMDLNKTALLWNTLGFWQFRSIINQSGQGLMLIALQGHLIFNSPNPLTSPLPFNGTRVGYDISGFNVYLQNGIPLAGTNFAPFNGNITMVTANNNRTVWNGILPGTMNVTRTGHTKTTAVELWENQICYVDDFYIPVANFVAVGDNTIGNAPFTTSFTDLSTGNITVWNWSFGDGTFFNTTNALLRNPPHTYLNPGTYTVNLTVTTRVATNSTSKIGYIVVLTPPSAAYNTTVYTDPAPLHPGVNVLVYSDQNNNTNLGINLNYTAILLALRNMHFNYTATNDPNVFNANLGTPPVGGWTLVIWDEELYDPPGGTYDNIQTYINGGGKALATEGNMDLNKTAPLWNTFGFWQFRAPIYDAGPAFMLLANPAHPIFTVPNPVANPVPFNGNPVGYGIDGFNLWLQNGVPLAGTNFAPFNGNITTVTNNTNRTVFNGILPGTMNVTAAGHNKTTAIELWENEISFVLGLPSPPVAKFTSNVTAGAAPLNVQFTDQSTGAPVTWNWSFGDGTFSAAVNPTHTFATGTYVVNLTVTNANGSTRTILGSTLPSSTITAT